MKPKPRRYSATWFEQLEQRTLLSVNPALPLASYLQTGQQQAPAVQLETVASLVASALANAPAGDPIYMKYGGITGDVTAKGFVGDIQLTSFQWGVGGGSGTGGGSGGSGSGTSAPSVSEVVVTKNTDSSSVSLVQEAFGGTASDVEIDFVQTVKGTAQAYLKVDLSNTLISGFLMSSGGDDRPTESLSLNFTKISFTSIGTTGQTQTFAYDLTQAQSAITPQPLTAPANSAAVRGDAVYAKYGSITGNVTAKGFANDIEVNSFQWGMSRTIGNPTGGADREGSTPSVSEVVITKNTDSSSVPLIQEALDGTASDVELDFAQAVKGAPQTYLKLELSDSLVSSFSMSSAGDNPTESLSLNFTKISLTAVGGTGQTQTFAYDLTQAQATEIPQSPAPPGSGAPESGAPGTVSKATRGDPIYAKYGNINGDVTAKGFTNDIEIDSFQWGFSRTIGSPAGGGSGDRESSSPSVSEIVVTKTTDSSSAPLMQEALDGTASSVEIDFVQTVKGKPLTYLKLDLSDTLIDNYSMSSGGDRPTESLSLNFNDISLTSVGSTTPAQTFAYDLVQAQATETPQPAGSAAPLGTPVAVRGDALYVKYGSINGNVTAKGFANDIEISSFQWGISNTIGNPSTGADRESSAPSVSEIVVTKTTDSSSVPLIQQAFGGTASDVELDFVQTVKGKPQASIKLDLSNTLIDNFSMSSGGDRPTESLSLNFTKISLTSVGTTGQTQTVAYDLATAQSDVAAQPSAAPVTAAATTPTPTSAHGDPIYMSYGNITGDVAAKGFKGDISLDSFQWGVSRTIGSPTGGADREASAPSVSEIVITKTTDSSTVPLIQQAFGGTDSAVELDFVDAAPPKGSTQPYLKLDLSNTLIDNFAMSSGGERPTESLSLNFTKISLTAVGTTGQTQTFSYDLAQAQADVAAQPSASPVITGAPPISALAAGDPIYAKYGTIPGDVTAKGFKSDISLNSFQWGVSRTIGSPTGGADREASAPNVSEIVITKNTDSSSVPLIQQALEGSLNDVEIDFTQTIKGVGQPYLILDLSSTLLDGFAMNSGGGLPTEALSLNFAKISFAYLGSAGQVQTFVYDVATGAAE